jgi:hypothetical protein
VVVFVETTASGAVRLKIDDVSRRTASSWTLVRSFTAHEFDGPAFRTMTLPREDVRGIGEAVYLRLAALEAVRKRPRLRASRKPR